MVVDPKSRGLEEKETSNPQTKAIPSNTAKQPEKEPTKITRIIGFGSGWIHVEMDNGIEYKRSGGSIAWRYNNVGNIKFGEFAKSHGALGGGHESLSIFPTLEMSRKARKALLFTPVRGYNELPLLKAIHKYAPESDGNNPDQYAHYVAKAAHVSYLKILKTFTDEEQELALNAMERMEGFKPGTVEKVSK